MKNRYTILPFRFDHFNEKEYLLTNDVGEYIFLNNDDFEIRVHGFDKIYNTECAC